MRVQLKRFLMEEAELIGITPTGVFNRIQRGWYRGKILFRRKNQRVVFITRLTDDSPPPRRFYHSASNIPPRRIIGNAEYMRRWRKLRQAQTKPNL